MPLDAGRGRQGRLDARVGLVVVMDDTTVPGAGRVAARAVLRPGVLRPVHALPRGHRLARARSCSASSTATVAGGPRPAARRVRQHQRPGIAVAAAADHDLPARPVVAVADRLVLEHVPRRVPRPHQGRAAVPLTDGTHAQDEGRRSRRVTITLDGKAIEARQGELIIAAAERAGVYIPRFCYHPRMKPVGMCRMCLVEVEGPRGLAAAARVHGPVADGMEVVTDIADGQEGPGRRPRVPARSTTRSTARCATRAASARSRTRRSPSARARPASSRRSATGRSRSRSADLVLLDRERCIQCARCTRFADEIAGDPLIDFIDRGDDTEVNTFPDQPFASYFSGNTVQICPVGALTGQPYRFKARPWDLEQVESHLHVVLGRLPHGGAVVGQPAHPLPRHRQRPGQPGLAVRQGPLRLRGGQQRRAGSRAPLVRDGRRAASTAPWAEALDAAADGLRRAVEPPARRGRPSSAAPGSPTRTPTPGPSWPRA